MDYVLFLLVPCAVIALVSSVVVVVGHVQVARRRRRAPAPADGFRLPGMDGEELTGVLEMRLRGGLPTWRSLR